MVEGSELIKGDIATTKKHGRMSIKLAISLLAIFMILAYVSLNPTLRDSLGPIATERFALVILSQSVTLLPLLLFASLGELVAEKSGVVNLGVEGLMLMAAFSSFAVARLTNDAWIGILTSIIVVAIIGFVFSFLTITLCVDQIVVGLGIYLFGFGFSDVLYGSMFGSSLGGTASVTTIKPIGIPVLSNIPYIGQVLFNQNLLVYLSLILVPLVSLFLAKTSIGLRIRAVGENPRAADTMGINVHRMRYLATIIGSILSGLSGAYLAVGQLGYFQFGYTAGRGFIALAMVYFANWNPYKTLLAVFLYDLVDSTQAALVFSIPYLTRSYYFFNMMPYLFVVALIPILGRRARAPKFLAVPYRKV